MSDPLDLSRADPKGLIRESFRIEGITAAECRSIFVDWALSLPDGVDAAAAMRLVIDSYAPKALPAGVAHPMVAVLTEGVAVKAAPPQRRGGRAGRLGR
ncbi:MAG: hypothetical protein Q4G22_10630 [Paracoccus sp. (in: a-proteobacteria)]|uniref:hypothetical protein n=1 Tax=Paracoccus sp. TaxID=267 RepID=UPI0026DFED83|nr:hypothetical protein [Paracoccus sp. (in: a-proteobacteria)]MDO5632281.1 hypothetical protein [Paracoccus sp. (in: a-proteobacteria)]